MPASHTTTIRIAQTITEWQNKHSVSQQAVEELLRHLTLIPGNKSFEQTTVALLKAYRKHADTY